MKKCIAAAVAVAFSFALIACGGGDKAAKSQVWKLAFNQSPEHPQAQALKWLSEEFAKATNGKYKIEISHNELLGNQKEAFESLQNGVIQMAMLGNPIIEAVNADFGLISLPGLYDSVQHQQNVFTSDVLKGLFDSTRPNHFIVLSGIHAGVRNVYGKKPVHTPADLKGMKIRVQQSQSMIDVINAMGGVAVAMSQGEVYTAIQQGVLDGAENNEVTYYDLKQYEVAPVYSYTKHFMIPDILVINDATYDSLSADEKKIFDDLIKQTVVKSFEIFLDKVGQSKQAAIDKGAKFVEDVDASVFQKRFVPLVNKFINAPAATKGLNRNDLYKQIKAVK
ncbi:MAG: TRAP transporter substrate-binding protein [Elusimicrobiota bacterium]|jgi:tripartite ATP-independent transporter DctP family solute receptor|nr:TRAP transporter substrate-binding protein [Elusimicrobiota bacterium]